MWPYDPNAPLNVEPARRLKPPLSGPPAGEQRLYAYHAIIPGRSGRDRSPTITAPEPPVDFTEAIDHAELIGTETEAQIIAYDSEGEVIGTLAIWSEDDGRIILTSDYADGYAETTVRDGAASTDTTLPPEVIQRRADAIRLEIARSDPGPQEGKFACALTVIAAAWSCVTLSPVCPIAAYGAACACIPLAMKDFECPSI